MADDPPGIVPPGIVGVFRQPFRQQVAFFRGKLGKLVPTRRWDDLDRSAHDTAFMVAGAQKADLLADLAAAVDRAVTEGKSLDAFRKDFAAAVARNDWHGWTGEDTKGGRAWRTRTIYRTNTYTSYSAGRLAQLREGNFAYWVYRHGGSQEPRPEHLSWDGIALPPDHPFWETHYPPSDWGCSCYVVGARNAAGVRRLGGDPDKALPDNWQQRDPRTGAPEGIGKGWDYAPGDSVSDTVQAVARKVGAWDYQIGKAFLGALPPQNRDAIVDAYRRLPSVADDLRRFAARTIDRRSAVRGPTADLMTLGMLTTRDIDLVRKAIDIDADGYDFSLTRAAIAHVQNKHGPDAEMRPDQRPVLPDDFGLLPRIIAEPDLVKIEGVSEIGETLVRYQKMIGNNRYVAIFAVGGKKRRTLTLKTFFIQAKK